MIDNNVLGSARVWLYTGLDLSKDWKSCIKIVKYLSAVQCRIISSSWIRRARSMIQKIARAFRSLKKGE